MVLWLLSSSARRRNIMILMYFLKDRENLGAPSPETPLHLAAYANLPFFVDIFLLEDDNLVNTVGTDHDTPLIWASETGSVECIKKLLDAGADPNIVENDGWTALHWAARSGHVDAAKLLLSYGARSDARDSDGDTPLDWALERGHRGIIDLLRKQQADHWDSKYYEGKRQHETSAICSNSRTSGFIP
jgi:ankyrin repeat protein